MASNKMRVVYDNAAKRTGVSIAASTTAGTLIAANLLTDNKAEVWRSTATSATLTQTFTSPELISCVALPFCNFTAAATMRVRGYTNIADPSPAFDTGNVLCCPPASLGNWTWAGLPLGVNSFIYGGGAYGVVWFTVAAVQKLVIDIIDTTNTEGYVEAACLVTGAHWTPDRNAEYGAEASFKDLTNNYRTDSGSLRSDIGTRHKTLKFDLKVMTPQDRATFWRIVKGAGLSIPIFISLFPENSDAELEQNHQVYGKLSSISSIMAASYNIYSAPCEIEEI